MDYNLNIEHQTSTANAFKNMLHFMNEEKRNLIFAFFIMLLNALLSMVAPFLIGYTIDHFIQGNDYQGLLGLSALLLVLYMIISVTEYAQTIIMGTIGQKMLFSLRNAVFAKLQSLPIAFFNQNKAGDLISRINNDTDKVNQFFSQSLMQFTNSIFTMIGATVFLLSINFELGGAALIPAIFILVFVMIISPIVKKKNAKSMKSTGFLSAEIQEGLTNFKTIITFNRRAYFREKFEEANERNYQASVTAGIWNNIFTPVFSLFSNIAQLIVLIFGIHLISQGNFTIGLLISFIAYTNSFYQPLRQLAALWASFQTAMAAWDRISIILSLENNLIQLENEQIIPLKDAPLLNFRKVSFSYPGGKKVLLDLDLTFEKGKTYALVGPTGGGKTTTASLISRLYDPTEGQIFFKGKDLRSYSQEELSSGIGFILQDPFLFNGTIRDNILYGNERHRNLNDEELTNLLRNEGVADLLAKFEDGLNTFVVSGGDSMSLGEKQILAFIRALLRKPELLILDEATANIDTVTEKLLEDILSKLPNTTTKVIIAHRLNTIENADEIFFVNSGKVRAAGDLEEAIQLLSEEKRES